MLISVFSIHFYFFFVHFNVYRVKISIFVINHSIKFQLTTQYKEKRQVVDDLKEQLQLKITEYTKFTESGQLNLLDRIMSFRVNLQTVKSHTLFEMKRKQKK